ncbi:uncharacterized protein BJX67DRAFT_152653 [Aspergillus lucknowensis]|uniref:Uncharacterized protein n=1 Tax=Aspergillus lucknowensis TaxID=176173 RepID=A0ABR4LNC3_9EURO
MESPKSMPKLLKEVPEQYCEFFALVGFPNPLHYGEVYRHMSRSGGQSKEEIMLHKEHDRHYAHKQVKQPRTKLRGVCCGSQIRNIGCTIEWGRTDIHAAFLTFLDSSFLFLLCLRSSRRSSLLRRFLCLASFASPDSVLLFLTFCWLPAEASKDPNVDSILVSSAAHSRSALG